MCGRRMNKLAAADLAFASLGRVPMEMGQTEVYQAIQADQLDRKSVV